VYNYYKRHLQVYRSSSEAKQDKMEKARNSIAIGLVLLVISNALFENTEGIKFNPGCFAKCLVLCAPFKNPFMCAADCVINCLGKLHISHPESWKDETSEFCQIGCAISTCATLIAKENPGKSLYGMTSLCSAIFFMSPIHELFARVDFLILSTWLNLYVSFLFVLQLQRRWLRNALTHVRQHATKTLYTVRVINIRK